MNRSILIIEDMMDMRMCLQDFFCNAGFIVNLADNGESGLQCLSQECDVIILDLNMPVMDGYEFLQMKAQQKKWDRIPVIVFSSETDANTLLGKTGVVAVWPKVCNFSELVSYVDNLTSRDEDIWQMYPCDE